MMWTTPHAEGSAIDNRMSGLAPSADQATKAMSPVKPIPTRALKAQIHGFAESLAQNLNFGPGEPIEPLVNRLGGKIVFKNPVGFNDRLPESIVVRKSNDFTIFVPSMTSSERDRFTIAHELGHLVLHYPLCAKQHPGQPMAATRWVDENDEDQQRAEWEANWFAAAFLMGSAAFREAHKTYKGVLELVAVKFGVSPAAARVRAKTLGLAK